MRTPGSKAATLASAAFVNNSRVTTAIPIRGAHIMFCNLDELVTPLLSFLHYIIDQLRNTCDNKFYLIPYNHFHSHTTKCPVRMTGLLPAVLTFREGIFELRCILTTAREHLFKSAFKVKNTVLEINLSQKPLFAGGSDGSCQVRQRWMAMTVVVEWQLPLP